MSGSGGGGGYEYQANVLVYVAAHALSGQALNWFPILGRPVAISQETGGPGDDIRVELENGQVMEVQASSGLQRVAEFDRKMKRLYEGLKGDPELLAVLIVDSRASGLIRSNISSDIERIGDGRTDHLSSEFVELANILEDDGRVDPEAMRRLRICTVNLDEGSDGQALVQSKLGDIVGPENAAHASALLFKRGMQMLRQRGRSTIVQLVGLLDASIGIQAEATVRAAIIAQYLRTTSDLFSKSEAKAIRRAGDPKIPLKAVYITPHVIGLEDAETSMDRASDQHEAEPIRRNIDPSLPGALAYKPYTEEEERPETAKFIDEITAPGVQVLLGGAGAGKSTAAAYITAREAELAANGHGRFPVFAAIVDAINAQDEIQGLIGRNLSSQGPGLKEVFDAEWRRGNCLVVLDGLDEIRTEVGRTAAVRKIERLTASMADNCVIVTSRPAAYEKRDLAGSRIVWRLLPWSWSDIREYVRQFFTALAPTDEAGARRCEQTLIHALETNAEAKELARVPLLLSLLGYVIHRGDTQLPGDRASLYEKIVGLMVEDWPTVRSHGTRGETEANSIPIDAIAQLAWKLHDGTDTQLWDEQHVKNTLANVLAHRGYSQRDIDETSRQILDAAVNGTGLLVVSAADRFKFVHRSIGAYLCAQHLANEEGQFTSRLSDLANHSRWHETIRLAIALMARQKVELTEQAIEKLIEPNPEIPLEQVLNRRLRLAAECVADAPALSDSLASKVMIATASRDGVVPCWIVDASLADALHLLAGHVPSDEAIASMFPMVNHKNWRVRQAVLCVLTRAAARDSEVFRACKWFFENATASPRCTAALGLWIGGRRDEDVVEAIADGLTGQEAHMGPIDGMDLEAAFVSLIRSENGSHHAERVLMAMGPHEGAADSLIELLAHSESMVRYAVRNVLDAWGIDDSQGAKIRDLLQHEDIKIRVEIVAFLIRQHQYIDDAWSTALDTFVTSPDVAADGARGIAYDRPPPDPVAESLVALLQHDNDAVRDVAFSALRSHRERIDAVVPRLVELLTCGDADAELRSAFVLTWWKCRDEVLPTLRRFIVSDDKSRQYLAAWWLIEWGEEDEAAEVAMKAAFDESDPQAHEFAECLLKLGRVDQAREACHHLIRKGERHCRSYVMHVLEQCGPAESSIELFRELMQESELSFHLEFDRVLGGWEPSRSTVFLFLDIAGEQGRTLMVAPPYAAQWRNWWRVEGAWDYLLEQIRARDDKYRAGAIALIRSSGLAHNVPELLIEYSKSDSESVRFACMEAFVQIGDNDQVADRVFNALSEESELVRKGAADALHSWRHHVDKVRRLLQELSVPEADDVATAIASDQYDSFDALSVEVQAELADAVLAHKDDQQQTEAKREVLRHWLWEIAA